MTDWSGIVYEGLQRIITRRLGQVECPCRIAHEELTDGRACHCCGAAV